MRVSIITEGGKNIGFGHITRCLAIGQACKERKINIQFVVNADESVKGLLKNTKYLRLDWLKRKKKLFQIIENSDFTVIDSYLAPVSLYQEISRKLGGKLIMIDDYKRLDYPSGIVVNPSIYGDKLDYPEKDGMSYLLGKDYIILRKEFWATPKKIIKQKVKNILVTFGGTSHYELADKLCGYLKERFDFNCQVVDGLKNRLSAKKMLSLMLRSDICISGGGQTTYELARVGVPAIGICFADNQTMNLEGWSKKGFVEYIKSDGLTGRVTQIEKALNRLLPYQARVKVSRIGKSCVDGKGPERIVDAMIKSNKESNVVLRKAQKSDCRDLWKWRNDKLVRKWSFNRNRIDYKQHTNWFLNKLKDKKTIIYVAGDGKKCKLGQTRFQLNGRSACINVNLNPDFFGRGLGSRLIRVSSELLFNENNIREITAEIFAENEVSLKAFTKAGYVFFAKGKPVNNKEVFVYKLKRAQ